MQVATESGNWKNATRSEIYEVMDVEKDFYIVILKKKNLKENQKKS